MKKIILIILLAISVNAFSQVYISNERQPIYDTGADSLFSRYTTAGVTLTKTTKALISNMFTMLKDTLDVTSLQNALDCFWVVDFKDTNASKINWVKNNHNLSGIGTLVWDSSGLKNGGGNSYVLTDYNPTVDKVMFAQDNGSCFIFRKGYNTGTQETYIIRVGVYLFELTSYALSEYQSLNGSGRFTYAPTTDFFSFSRDQNDSVAVSTGNGAETMIVSASTGIASGELILTAWNTTGLYSQTVSKTKILAIGKSFTAVEIRGIKNIIDYWEANKNATF